jgi:hypothetical protein
MSLHRHRPRALTPAVVGTTPTVPIAHDLRPRHRAFPAWGPESQPFGYTVVYGWSVVAAAVHTGRKVCSGATPRPDCNVDRAGRHLDAVWPRDASLLIMSRRPSTFPLNHLVPPVLGHLGGSERSPSGVASEVERLTAKLNRDPMSEQA